MKRQIRIIALIAASIFSVSNTLAQTPQPLDRTKIPPPGPAPMLHVPTWTKSQLANGALLIVSERHNLPLVSFTITFVGGSNQFEPVAKRGLANMTSAML